MKALVDLFHDEAAPVAKSYPLLPTYVIAVARVF
jgi:hypothetical protein